MPPAQSVRGGQTARQAKTPTPIIMQSVKSTQVQKPVLQTAVAPASPPVSTPPPSYALSVQHKQVQAANIPAQSVQGSPPPTSSPTCHYVNSVTTSSTIPTTDPPSYYSTMQAIAAARGYNYMPQQLTSILMQDVPVQELDLSSTPLAHIPVSQVTTVDSIITTHPRKSLYFPTHPFYYYFNSEPRPS